jgi:hypothetical protein
LNDLVFNRGGCFSAGPHGHTLLHIDQKSNST